MKEQEAKGLLSSLGLKTRLSKISLFGDILFSVYKMNEIMNKLLLVGDTFMPEMHLKQPGFGYTACGLFTRNKETNETFLQARHKEFIYGNDLHKACFQHDMVYGKSKDLTKRTQSDKVLREKNLRLRLIKED